MLNYLSRLFQGKEEVKVDTTVENTAQSTSVPNDEPQIQARETDGTDPMSIKKSQSQVTTQNTTLVVGSNEKTKHFPMGSSPNRPADLTLLANKSQIYLPSLVQNPSTTAPDATSTSNSLPSGKNSKSTTYQTDAMLGRTQSTSEFVVLSPDDALESCEMAKCGDHVLEHDLTTPMASMPISMPVSKQKTGKDEACDEHEEKAASLEMEDSTKLPDEVVSNQVKDAKETKETKEIPAEQQAKSNQTKGSPPKHGKKKNRHRR